MTEIMGNSLGCSPGLVVARISKLCQSGLPMDFVTWLSSSQAQNARSVRAEARPQKHTSCDETGLWQPGASMALPLGIVELSCHSCGATEAVTDRVLSECGQLFCEECWCSWERCGWWKPSIRVSTSPPKLSEGRPVIHGEDAFFLSGFLCDKGDMSVMRQLKSELETEGKEMSDWHGARHLGVHFESGTGFERSFRMELVRKMEQAFGIKASAVRLNLYRSQQDYKPLHYDRGRDAEGTPQLTVGASFGALRELTLMHVKSGVTMSFPQHNGDVFAFTPELNEVFMHGVPHILPNSPSALEPAESTRMSLIIWGARIKQ
mmetsp:Transcript_41390/g.96175  ORF Transcript_41390/g.96175 Transcript_41390/m.96175 type:complete len:320 (-) Transcript_41390:110-1069(-)